MAAFCSANREQKRPFSNTERQKHAFFKLRSASECDPRDIRGSFFDSSAVAALFFGPLLLKALCLRAVL